MYFPLVCVTWKVYSMSEMELKKSHTFVKIVTHRNKPEVFSKKLGGNQPIQSVACM